MSFREETKGAKPLFRFNHHFTGSKEHNTAMRSRAKTLGIKVNKYGLFHGEELIVCSDEKEFFLALGLACIPPELREKGGEIEAALENGVILELNANPARLDLDWRYLNKVRDMGIAVSFNPDAHEIKGFSDTAYGVAIARKGWFGKKMFSIPSPGRKWRPTSLSTAVATDIEFALLLLRLKFAFCPGP